VKDSGNQIARLLVFSLYAGFIYIPIETSPAVGDCLQATLLASDRYWADNFGSSLAVDGAFLVVGAEGTGYPNQSPTRAYVFEFVNGAWIERVILRPHGLSNNSYLGDSVAIHGDVIAIGAFNDGDSSPYQTDGAGAVVVYRRVPSGLIQEATLRGNDTVRGDFFGRSVAVHNGRILVGAIRTNRSAGVAYLFEFDGRAWVQTEQFSAPVSEQDTSFATEVALRDDLAVIGAASLAHPVEGQPGRGAVFVFRRQTSGWLLESTLASEDSEQERSFGRVLALDGERLAVGARTINSAPNVYVFRVQNGSWQREDRFPSPIGALAIRGNVLLAGEVYGFSASLFVRHRSEWILHARLPAAPLSFRTPIAVALTDTMAFLGLEEDDLGRPRAGSVSVYTIGGGADCDGAGINDACQFDCDCNGIPDICEGEDDLPSNCLADCNENRVPDSCDIGLGTSPDCDDNGHPDDCQLDCNGNGVADSCDIADETSTDCNSNGIPDDCEVDCNGNRVGDICEIRLGDSSDCDHNNVPDECQGAVDCNRNDVPDRCEILSGALPDVNHDGLADSCEYPGQRFSVELPRLVGVYGGIAGISHSTSFDFDRTFRFVNRGWLDLTIRGPDDPWYPYYYDSVFITMSLNGVWLGDQTKRLPRDGRIEVGLPAAETLNRGAGSIHLYVSPAACCDFSAYVERAALHFDAVPTITSASLVHWASFQNCFAAAHSIDTVTCGLFDFDLDYTVNVDDYEALFEKLRGP
jgi:hypothetical protein